MLHKTKGIVLHHIGYSETSIIARIYTELFGLQSYLVKGVRSRKSGMRSSYFQPLTMLDMVVYHREKRELQHIREAEVAEPFSSIASDIRKSTLALFLSEVLYKSIQAGEANTELFHFMENSFRYLEQQDSGVEYFHLHFLLKLSLHLGFYPNGMQDGEARYFDLREGRFSPVIPSHPDYLDESLSHDFSRVSNCHAGDLPGLAMSRSRRQELLNALIIYYQIHLNGLGTIRSAEILREVFS